MEVVDLKTDARDADTGHVDAAERREILNRYRDHSRRFEAAAARRSSTRRGAVIPFTPPASREVGQDPIQPGARENADPFLVAQAQRAKAEG